jgi:hypothetical protein
MAHNPQEHQRSMKDYGSFRISKTFHSRICPEGKDYHRAHEERSPFTWTEKHWDALETLITLVTTAPVLTYPDLEKQFKLEVDTLAFAVGAILFQRDDNGCKRDVEYYSKALNTTERNYNIWDQEFLAVITALKHWRHLLISTSHKIIV